MNFRLAIAIATIAMATSPVSAKDIFCSGTLIEIDLKPGATWPYAVVYDTTEHRTCVIDRLNAGHDPLRGSCNVGMACIVRGNYQRKVNDTYFLDRWDAKAPDGVSPSVGEVPKGR